MSVAPQSPAEVLPRLIAALEAGRPCRLTVTGTSMLPFLRDRRDAVLLEKAAAPFERGQILLYLRPHGQPILHRIHRVREDGMLLMCGDAQRMLEPIAPGQVLARVTHVERGGVQLACAEPALRRKVALWQRLFPLRRYIMAVLRRCGRLK